LFQAVALEGGPAAQSSPLGITFHPTSAIDGTDVAQVHDRAALKRLLRYCARPPFAMDRLRQEGTALVSIGQAGRKIKCFAGHEGAFQVRYLASCG
jgi:hypothetical protein